ncbi:hypothetical protein MMC07_005241 [Pseudocyphellaria aurata]|nr:hypothetical protein [Pseudocyphellaria aurata]
MTVDDTPIIDGGLGPAITDIRVIEANKSLGVAGRGKNHGSGRVAGLMSLSRRSWQPRGLIQKPGDLICVENEFCFSFEGSPLCLNLETVDFHLEDGTTGNLDIGEYTLPNGQTGNFNLEPESTYPDTASVAASRADNSALATTDGSAMTGSSVTPSRGPETRVPQATSMEKKISGHAPAATSGGRSSPVQQTAMQATTAANHFSNFTSADLPSSLGKNISSVTLTPESNVSSVPISFAHVAASPCGMWSPRILTAGIAIIVGLGFFSLL